MKRCKKIIVVLIVLAMISIVVLPVFTSLSVNMGTICGLLSKIANSVIVNASDDYTYAGNVVFNLNASNELYVYCSDYLCNRVVKCSINNSEFQDFLIGSDTVPTENDVTSIILKEENEQEIARCIIIKDEDKLIIMQKSTTQYQLGDMIFARLKDGQEDYDYRGTDYEYSFDEGENYRELNTFRRGPSVYIYWDGNQKVNGGTLFSDRITIRRISDNSIVYQTPNMGDIQEEYNYENGKTKVTFKNTNDEIENVEYSYEIDGQEADGNVIEVEEDSSVILRAKANIEFSEKVIEKEVQVKVIKTEEPIIEIDEENNLEITPGNVENDEIANIYYIIDDGDPIVYTEKVALDIEPGEHTINAYQVTTNGIESQMAEENITIESDEAEEDNKEEESEEQNEENKEENKEEQNEEKSEDKTEPEKEGNEDSSNKENAEEVKDDKKEDTNKEEKNNSSKENDVAKKENKLNKLLPQTGDKVIIFAVVVMGIVLLNVVINSKKR